jgi:hypothetical protein
MAKGGARHHRERYQPRRADSPDLDAAYCIPGRNIDRRLTTLPETTNTQSPV